MKQNPMKSQPGGPLLDKPSILLPKVSPFSAFAFYAALLLLGSAGAMACFFTAFRIPVNLSLVFFAMLFSSLLCSARLLLPRRRWLPSLLGFLVWLFLVWCNFPTLMEAFKWIVNIVSEAYSEKLSFDLPIFLYLGYLRDPVFHFTTFAAAVQFPFVWLLSVALIDCPGFLCSFCLTGLLLLLPLGFSILPAPWALGLLGLFWLFLFLCGPSLRQRRLLTEGRDGFQAAGAGFARAPSLLLLLPIALCMLLLYRASPPDAYQRPQLVNDLRSSLSEGLDLPGMLRTGKGSAGGKVDLAALGKRRYTGETMLRVKYDWKGREPAQEKDYLRSFVGSTYTGSSWERLDWQGRDQAQAALGDWQAQTLYADLDRLLPSPDGNSADYGLLVDNVGENPGRVYVPYGLDGSSGLPGGIKADDDGAFKPSRLLGVREYSLSAQALPQPEEIPSYRQRLLDSFPDLTKERDEGDGELPLELLPDEIQSLTGAVENYDEFAYQHYTQVPDGLEGFLADCWEDMGGAGHMAESTDDKIELVRQTLASRCSYTLDPPTLPRGEDFVEFFLTESRRGYCVHFATAAVMLLRQAGVPARYAEGYAVPVDQDGLWAEVPDRNAHAWAEVWFDGAGWVPVEMTPAGPNAPAAYPNATRPEPTATPEPTPGTTSTPAPTPTTAPQPESTPASEPTPQQPSVSVSPAPGGTVAHFPGKALLSWEWLAAPAAVLLIFLLIFVVHAARLRWRQSALRQPDKNKAALLAYAHILKLYKAAAFLPKEKALENRQPPETIRELALKARFSSHALTQEELDQFLVLAEQLEKQLKENLPLLKRLQCKYLLALF